MSDKTDTLQCSDALAQLLTDLRTNQKAFFKSPPGSAIRAQALENSKRLEKELDEFLKGRNQPKTEATLFAIY
ncbi:MAG: hypothetical protein LCH81_03625 [Bacteroidetes bacterium]|nr:hypothetical protein [Bacteroidota bacterium]